MDMKPGSQILCADGSIVMEVISADPKAGTVRAKCMNNATLGYAPCVLLMLIAACALGFFKQGWCQGPLSLRR